MDSPGWFDSGYVVPGTDSSIGGKKIFTNYNNTRMYIEGQNSGIEEDFRNHWYYTGQHRTFSKYVLSYTDMQNWGTENYDIYSNYNSSSTLAKGSIWGSSVNQIYNKSYTEIKGYCNQIRSTNNGGGYTANYSVNGSSYSITARETRYHYTDGYSKHIGSYHATSDLLHF